MAKLWFDSSSHMENYYIGRHIDIVNNWLLNVKPPKSISRRPRKISERRFWKANEWRSWLLYFALPCLDELLAQPYLEHFSILVESLHILLNKKISRDELELVDSYLTEFVSRFQTLYGIAAMTFNVHLLTHLTKSVQMWGPLWTHSAFVFLAMEI